MSATPASTKHGSRQSVSGPLPSQRSEPSWSRSPRATHRGASVARPRARPPEATKDVRDAVVELGQRWTASQRALLPLVVELDRSGAWALDGARTCSHWVATALDIEVCTAREWIRVGLALERFSVVAAAFSEGRLSYSKVRTLTRVVKEETEADLCELAERTPAGRLATAIAAWLAPREDPADTEDRHQQARSLTFRAEPDGMVIGSFRLPPVPAAHLIAAVDAWVMRQPAPRGDRPRRLGPAEPTPGGDNASADASSPRNAAAHQAQRWPSVAQQRADALSALVTGGGVNVETEVVIHVRGAGCTLDDGTPVAGSLVERVAPQSFLRVLIHDAERRPINASGRHRHPTARQRRVVLERHRGCVDCGETELLEYDHEPPFEVTRRTVVDELETRCRTCHRARHGGSTAR